MSGKGTGLQNDTTNYPNKNTKNEAVETLIFEEIQIESITVSEIKKKNKGMRFARLKKVLRKRSASIL